MLPPDPTGSQMDICWVTLENEWITWDYRGPLNFVSLTLWWTLRRICSSYYLGQDTPFGSTAHRETKQIRKLSAYYNILDISLPVNSSKFQCYLICKQYPTSTDVWGVQWRHQLHNTISDYWFNCCLKKPSTTAQYTSCFAHNSWQ